jgi:hypothetical protein
MIELSQLTVLIVAEILAALLIISGVLVFFTLLRKSRIRKAAQQLAQRVQNDKPERRERLKHLLTERYGYAGGELEQALHNILQSEMQLYQNIINGSLKDDQLFVQQVDVDVENLVLAYQNLQSRQAAPVAPVVSDDEASEMQRLQEENLRLSDELRVTMDTMGRMLNEYSTMFAGGFDETPKREKPSSPPQEKEDNELFMVSDADQALGDDADADMGTGDIDIPPYEAERGADLSMLDDQSGLMDDEVSEIIDEVMEMADGMTQAEEQPAQAEEAKPSIDESLMDELEKVEIEIPEIQNQTVETDDLTPGSLEDEWAKLLEEDAASKTDKKAGE